MARATTLQPSIIAADSVGRICAPAQAVRTQCQGSLCGNGWALSNATRRASWRQPANSRIKGAARTRQRSIAMGILKEFKEFAIKGNVVDMAVGIIIGGAFGTIVS